MPGPEVTQNADLSGRADSSTAGKTLKRIFRQDDSLSKIEAQPATSSMLMSRARMDIFVHLCRHPCDHTRSIARGLGKSCNGTGWHLHRLAEQGYLESARERGRLLYWPTGMVRPGDVRAISNLRREENLALLNAVIANGAPAGQVQLVRAVGERQQSVNVWLSELVAAGILERTGAGRDTRYTVSRSLLDTERHCLAASGDVSKTMLAILKNDGLLPKRASLRGTRLSVELTLPSGRERIVLECNPLAMLTKTLAGHR